MIGRKWDHRAFVRVIVCLVLGWGLQSAAQEQHRLPGEQVAIYNLVGEVEIVQGSGDDVTVVLVRGGADAELLETSVRKAGSRPSFIVEWPGKDIVYPRIGKRSRSKHKGRLGELGKIDIEVRGSGKGTEAWADLKVMVPPGKDLAYYGVVGNLHVDEVEGQLKVSTGSGSIKAERSKGRLEAKTGSGPVTVSGHDGPLAADTGSGAITISDVRGTEVTADTGSGSVALTNVEGEHLKAGTGSGHVRGSGITGASFSVDTGSGSIDLAGVACPDVNLDTGSGNVELELLEDVDRLVVDTGSGSVTLKVPESLGARVEVDTGSGGIDVKVPIDARTSSKDGLEGVLGDGEGRITVDTGSGRVRILGR